MPETQQILLFLITSAILTITPGPDILYVVTRGIAQGRLAALASATGFSLGCIAHTAFAVLGLSAVVMSSAFAFTIIKFLGASYLIYIGWKTFSAKATSLNQGDMNILSKKSIFLQSVTANILNPKVALFFIAFLPQFVSKEIGSVSIQMTVFGLLFIINTFVIFSLCGLLAGFIGDYLRNSKRAESFLNKFAGIILICLGVSLAFYNR